MKSRTAKSRALLLGLGALLLGACSQGLKSTGASGPTYHTAATLPALPIHGQYASGQVIVGYRDDAALDAAARRAGAQVTLRLPELHAALLTLKQLSVGQALYALQSFSGVSFAQPNYLRPRPQHIARPVPGAGARAQGITANPDPNAVPYFPQQWALKNNPPEGMSVAGAWDALKGAGVGAGSYTDGGTKKPVMLAYFAEPLPPTPDFDGQILPGLDFSAWLNCTIPNSADVPDPDAQNLVNGKCTPPKTLTTEDIRNIAANVQPGVNYNTPDNSGGEASLDASNMVANGAGILGAAYNAQLMPLVLFSDSGSPSDLVYAVEIVWAVQHGATILNNSLGGAANSPVVNAATNYALAQSALFVVSSGDNGDTLVSNPADVPGTLAVTSTGAGGHLSNDSQVAPYVRFGAPGDNIVVSAALDFTACDDAVACPLGVAPVPGYAYSGGTSSSSPYTAGILALMQGAYHQKFGAFMSAGAAEDLLYDTATPAPAGTQAYTNYRIPNAQKAVQAVLNLGAQLPGTRSAALVTVLGGSGAPVSQADVFLRNDQHTYHATTGYSLGLQPEPITQNGTAAFLNIAPGTYQVLVGGPETLLDGDNLGTLNPADRLTATGTVTVKLGEPATVSVPLPKTTFAVQMTTTSPNIHLAIAEPGGDGFVVAGQADAQSGTFVGLAGGERYTLGGTYQPGLYLIGLSTSDLQDGERAFVQLTVTENGKTSNMNLGPFTKGETSPSVSDGGVAGIVQLSPGITALHK